jgi:hypothetical protein
VREILKAAGHDRHPRHARSIRSVRHRRRDRRHEGRRHRAVGQRVQPLSHSPRTRFVADFVGQGVFLRGVAKASRASRPSSATCGRMARACAARDLVECCCGRTTSCTTTRARGRRKCARRRFAAPSSCTR